MNFINIHHRKLLNSTTIKIQTILKALVTFALAIIFFAPSANAVAFAGAGIEVDGNYIGGFGITRNEKMRGNFVG
jgi:hypothetical protein